MTHRDLLLMTAPIRENFDIPFHEIGPAAPHPRVALVAGLHGDEINGTFILARLADFLNGVEAGRFPALRLQQRVLVIPAVNVLGINTRSRGWPFDRTDINRMFPGSTVGETTQRIACTVLEATKRADYRIDIHSSSQDFEELPQVRLYDPSAEECATSRQFGLEAVMVRSPGPVFTTTLMHSWQVWPGQSFLLQVGHAGSIQLPHCQRVFQALVAFLGRIGVLAGVTLAAEEDEVNIFTKESAVKLYAEQAGMFVSDRRVGTWVRPGQELGYIYDSFNGNVHTKVVAPFAGLLTGLRRHPLLFEGDLLVRINRREH
jgi:predicted deacylase